MARIAVIADDLFEDAELLEPVELLRGAGHETGVVGKEADKTITGKNGASVTTDLASGDIDADDFDALLIPGGYSPDKVRTDQAMVELTRTMVAAGKPVAAICHAPWVLAEADVLRDRTITSYPSIRTDVVNAGATWVDKEVVQDGNLITSRHPGDIPAFADTLINQLAAD